MADKRTTDPDDFKPEGLRMSVSKDWLIGILVMIVSALMLIGVNNIQTQYSEHNYKINDHEKRLGVVEGRGTEVLRRLESMDTKIDKKFDSMDAKIDDLLGWKGK